MFEKEAEEYGHEHCCDSCKNLQARYKQCFKDGAEFGYNKAKEEVKYNLMMKLKDEGIVKPLKDSILRNERLSSQEQQELCAWIECAIDFGENLDECAKELELAKKANEWHYVKDGDLPQNGEKNILLYCKEHFCTTSYVTVGYFEEDVFYNDCDMEEDVIAWKEIVLPEEE